MSQLLTEANTVFQNLGVKHIKELSSIPASAASVAPLAQVERVIFLVRPLVSHMRLVAAHINALNSVNPNLQNHLLFAPYKTLICEKVLEDEGVLEQLHIGELEIGLVCVEKDVLTMDLGTAFRETTLEGDNTCVEGVANSVLLMEKLFGIIPHVKALGPLSHLVATKITKTKLEAANLGDGEAEESWGKVSDSIASLVMIDREVDMVTPLLTPLTYEGLVDELVGIKNSGIRVRANYPTKIVYNSDSACRWTNVSQLMKTLEKASKK